MGPQPGFQVRHGFGITQSGLRRRGGSSCVWSTTSSEIPTMIQMMNCEVRGPIARKMSYLKCSRILTNLNEKSVESDFQGEALTDIEKK